MHPFHGDKNDAYFAKHTLQFTSSKYLFRCRSMVGSGKCGLYSNQGIQHKNVLGCTALGTASTALQTKSIYIHAFQLFKSLKKKIQTF